MNSDRIRVIKMSGAGNDFLVLDRDQAEAIPGDFEAWVRRVCRRRVSAGADGVLVVRPENRERVAVQFYNPDGSTAFCGNGSRCAARYAHHRGFTGADLVLATAAGPVPAYVAADRVRLTLPAPRFIETLAFEVDGCTVEGGWIRAGSPHLVVFVEDPAVVRLERWGPVIRRDPRFGDEGVNVNVARRSGSVVSLRTFERGVEAETLACGSGAVASAFAARLAGAGDTIEVLPASGIPLVVQFAGPAEEPREVTLSGDARIIFEAELGDEAIVGFD